jgi:dimethylsulfone monooxygenase
MGAATNSLAPLESPVVSMSDRIGFFTDNKLKLGLFGPNCSSGRSVTMVRERWSGSWADNLRLAQMADDAGLEFILPIGRWKGYGGDTDYQGSTLETVTWATGLLAKTRRITVFGTVHAPLIHPVIAAKEFVTADHVGEGRFGLNVVCGWNEGEFEMFGVEQRDHEARYDYAQEWVDSIKQMWGAEDDFDFNGTFIKLKRVRAKPKPYGGSRPIIMNAGVSPTGQAFAVRNCDALFRSVRRTTIGDAPNHNRAVKELAAKSGKDIKLFTVGVITCRPTMEEAEAYYRRCIMVDVDWKAVDSIMAMQGISEKTHDAAELKRIRDNFANGLGGYPIVGDPEHVAAELAALSAGGFTGVGVSFVNYLEELPYFCAEVLPRLEKLGLRASPRS